VPLTAEKVGLLDRVAVALRLSGWQVLWLNADHPARVRLINGGAHIEAWIHIWNVTPGGRPTSRPLERRIQPTQAAAKDGFGIFAKSTGELSIAIRPDMLGIYLEQMQILHTLGQNADQLDALRQMASDPLEVEPDDLPASRRKVMTTTLRLLRDRRFGEKVLTAYGHRCAMCGVQLRLLDAAHILPVAHPDSNDNVTNGVALCALHHRAYDMALVAFDQTYEIIVSQDILASLAAEGRNGGLGAFQAVLAPTLLLPQTQASHPSLNMIAKANELRGWA